jgi:hypothetical protein
LKMMKANAVVSQMSYFSLMEWSAPTINRRFSPTFSIQRLLSLVCPRTPKCSSTIILRKRIEHLATAAALKRC